jgi:hypothetical protein
MTAQGEIGWPSAAADDRPIIGRVRVRASSSGDAGALRARVERLLSDDVLVVPGLPPSAVLCVRSLRAPLPINPARDGGAPPTAWRRALANALEKGARAAVCPLDGPVPPAATAVLFRDRAEMLACLARDWVRGAIGTWWWRDVVRATRGARVAPAQWVTDAPYVPAAARLLEARGDLAPFANALDTTEARAIVASVTAAHGVNLALDAPTRASILPLAEVAAIARWAPEALRPGLTEAARALVATTLLLARAPSAVARAQVLDAVRASLSPARAALLAGQTPGDLGVHRQPAARSDGTAAAAVAVAAGPDPEARMVQGRDATASLPVPSPSDRFAGAPRSDVPPARPRVVAVRLLEPPSEAASSPKDRAVHPGPAEAYGSSASDFVPTTVAERVDGVRRSTAATAPPAASVSARSDAPFNGEPSPSDTRSAPRSVPGSSAEAPTVRRDRVVSTAYGGALFLLNAFLALDLYGDFTRPFSRQVGVSPWTLIARVVHALLGDEADPQEPLWTLLADLAGPADDEETWPSEWRVDTGWLGPFPERDGWTWSRAEGRLRVVHPAGFVLVDAPLEADALTQRDRERAAYGSPAVAESTEAIGASSWLDHFASFLRARLHAAIRADSADASLRTVLRLRARVGVSDTHVDVHVALAELPIEVRLAGLDRDPGWVPAAGRSVAFHFV